MTELADTLIPRPVRGRRQGTSPGDAIYNHVFNAILEQRLPPGTRLTEDVLGDIFGVSRTTVRKALIRLEHEKIVEIRPNRGAVVASPSVEDAREIFTARKAVETAVVDLVMARIDEGAIEALRQHTAAENAAHRAGDRRRWIRLSGDFHLLLARIGGNRPLHDFLKELVSRTSLIIALYERPGKATCQSDEHKAFIDALAQGDGEQARTLMLRHLDAIEAELHLEGEEDAIDLHRVFAEYFNDTRNSAG